MGLSKSHRAIARGVCALVVGLLTRAAPAVGLGQKDDFESGLSGWHVGSASPGGSPMLVGSGGPAGAGDGFMQLTSTGALSGALSRLAVINQSTWTGPYTGFDGIAMDLANLGAAGVQPALQIRIALTGANGGQYISRTPVTLPEDGVWRRVIFPLTAAELHSITGSDVSAGLANVTELRIIHKTSMIDVRGDSIAANLGVDNIEAVIVPEPGTALIGVMGAFAMLGRRRRA